MSAPRPDLRGRRPLRIAMIGTKGVPARGGGVERIVEELGARLAARGHQVTVYCRRDYGDGSEPAGHRGMRLVWRTPVRGKHTSAISHAFLSLLDAGRRRYDVLHFHGLGTAPVSGLAWLFGGRVLFHIHGQEWRGGKWGRAARAYFRACESPGLEFASEVVVDTLALQRYYHDVHGKRTRYIPNAIDVPAVRDTGVLARLGVRPDGYLLFVGRLVPEKGLHHLMAAARWLRPPVPVIVVGGPSESDAYVREVKAAAPSEFRFAGHLEDAEVHELLARSLALVHPSEREGMSVVLLEAMAHGCRIVASDIPEMVETLGGGGWHFRSGDPDDLARVLSECLTDTAESERRRASARERAAREYAWGPVTDQFEELYLAMAGGSR